jgi:outer membrane lipoprotein-sorting protein
MNKVNKNVKKVLMLLLLLPLVAFTQSKHKQASEILQEITDKTKSYNSIKLEFTYQMENTEASIDEITQGNALVSGDKYRLDIAGQTVISDGQTIWTVISDAEEVQVNDAEEGEGGFSLTKMLSTYNDDYKSKLMSKITTLDGKNVYALDLTPNEKKNFDKVQLFVDKDKMDVYSIAIFDQNGSVYTYKITSFIANAPVSDKDFTFNEADFPDFDVIDMR